MKIKVEEIKLTVNGKTRERGKLTKKAPRIVWYTEHSAITEKLSNGKPRAQAEVEYLSRAARAILEAALTVLDKLSCCDQEEAKNITGAFFLRPPSSPVTYEDGEPVRLEDYEEKREG